MTHPDAPIVRPRLPDVALHTPDGAVVNLRTPRRSLVLVVLDDAPEAREARDAAWLAQLAEQQATIAEWDGAVYVVRPDAAVDAPGHPPPPLPTLLDPEGRVARSAGVQPPALVLADQWGEVHEPPAPAEGGRWPASERVTQWVRWAAIRCAG